MATSQSTIDFLIDQLVTLSDVKYRKMFGEYALYCDGKVVALVCDDELFIKPTNQGLFVISIRLFDEDVHNFEKLSEDKKCLFLEKTKKRIENPPYPNAKMWFLISGDLLDDREWLCELVKETANALPYPKMKKS